MKPLLVLGDTGLLGQALITTGTRHGISIRGASRRSTDIALDALDSAALARAIDEVQPATLINVIGLADVNECERFPDAAWRINARLPAVLAALCLARGIRLVHISTDHYFTGDGAARHDEAAAVTLVNEYARSKYAGERIALTCPGALSVRTNIVGFRGLENSPTFVEWLLGALERQTPIRLFSDFYTSSLSVAQFSEALIRILDTPVTGLINLAASEGASKMMFAKSLAAACGLSVRACQRGSIRAIVGAPRAESLVLDVRRAEALLGKSLPDLSSVTEQLASEYSMRKAQLEAPKCSTPL